MDTTHKFLDELSKYGLTEIQARTYYSLLTLGKTSATKVAKEQGVHRAEVYRVLRELKDKRLVTELKGRPSLYSPAPPEEAVNILLIEQEKKIERLRENQQKLVEWLNSQIEAKKAKPSVLVIDDDKTIRRTITEILQAEGFNIQVAKDGGEALEKSQREHYDVALVDIRLHDIDGIKLLKTLKRDNPEIKEIVVTGYPSLQNAVEAVNEGADGYIIKPFKPSALLDIIREKLAE